MNTAAPTPVVREHVAQSIEATRVFFAGQALRVADCCRRLADRFNQGGSLLVIGEGAQATDAQHVAVEFVHPVMVGKRALPAFSLISDAAVFSAGDRAGFTAALRGLARRDDVLLALSATGRTPAAIRSALAAGRAAGLLTILIAGQTADPSADSSADIVFRVEHPHPFVVQEVSESLYHVIWELVHVFFETDSSPAASFLPSPAMTRPSDLIASVAASTQSKAHEICVLREALYEVSGPRLVEAGRALAARVRRNGRLLAFGNGGSATDAQDAAVDCLAPPVAGWQSIPAIALINDIGIVSAIGNDVGFDHVFSRQVIALGREADVALGFSTSGESRNVLKAMKDARRRGLLTIGMSGGDGGALARSSDVDICVTVASDHIPRIQEAHATAWHAMLAVTQEELA